MSARLEKAKAALHDAKKHDRNDELQRHMLEIARTQAAIAGAEALEQLVNDLSTLDSRVDNIHDLLDAKWNRP